MDAIQRAIPVPQAEVIVHGPSGRQLLGQRAPPALLIHGEQDLTVSIRNSEELAKRLRDVGNQVRYVPVADTGHSGLLLGLA